MSIHLLKPLLMHPPELLQPLVQSLFFSATKAFKLYLQVLIFFNLFGFFLSYSTITWNSNINDDTWFRRVSLPIKHYRIEYLYPGLVLHHHLPRLLRGNVRPTSLFCLGCFSHNFQWTNFATASFLLLYSRCAGFLHSHVICCRVSPFSPHILHYGFFDVLSVLFFI